MDNVMKLMENQKDQCSGCYACYNACPVDAIRMESNQEGFWYPVVDEEKCIHCGRCIQVCQIDNHKAMKRDRQTEAYACMNKNLDRRLSSSSGGVFIELAQYVIDRGGYVFGAAFDENLHLRHTYASDLESCMMFMGSKYLQSEIGSSYSDAKKFLSQKKLVLFTGTPCQIHGLKLFLGREYSNLITVDLACHGVPSPAVFDKYIKELESSSHSKVVDFYFRSKKKGWNNFSREIHLENGETKVTQHNECPFVKGFSANLYLRPSCYVCKNKGDNRYSDLVMGDYWGVKTIHPKFSDDKGTFLLLVRSDKGAEVLNAVKNNFRLEIKKASKGNAFNPAIANPVDSNPNRDRFFNEFEKGNNSDVPLAQMIQPYLPKVTVKQKIKMMVPAPLKRFIKQKLMGVSRPIKAKDGISWKNYALEAFFENGETTRIQHDLSPYVKGFLSDLYLRPSCYQCQNKEENRFSDLTLADYWGVEGRDSDMYDDQGTSVVLVRTEKAKKILDAISLRLKWKQTDLDYVISCNPSLKYSAKMNPNRAKFFRELAR